MSIAITQPETRYLTAIYVLGKGNLRRTIYCGTLSSVYGAARTPPNGVAAYRPMLNIPHTLFVNLERPRLKASGAEPITFKKTALLRATKAGKRGFVCGAIFEKVDGEWKLKDAAPLLRSLTRGLSPDEWPKRFRQLGAEWVWL